MKHPDPLNDPPPTEEEKRRRAAARVEKTCPECGYLPWEGVRGHSPKCSESPIDVQIRYAKAKEKR